MDDNRIVQAEHKFLLALLKGGIQPICNAAYEIFQSPITVVDDVGRCIYQFPSGYVEREAPSSEKFLSTEESIKAQQAYATYKKPNLLVAYITDKDIKTAPILMGRFYENDTVAGHLGVSMEGREPDYADYQIADLFCRVLSGVYTISTNPLTANFFYRSYVLDILKGDVSVEDYKRINLETDSMSKPMFAVLVSPIFESQANSTADRRVCNALVKKYKGVYSVIYENNIVTVCCGLPKGEAQNPDSYGLLKELLESLAGYNYSTGISMEFPRMQDLKAYYKQALFTLTIGMRLNPEKKNHYFTDYSPLQFFLPISELPIPQTWLHPIISEMRIYDKMYNTEYLNTMKEFILSGKNRKASAKQLNVHLNTLNYRLDKMEDLFRIFQLNRQDYLHLFCSLLLIELD